MISISMQRLSIKVWKMLDLKNIERLKTTNDVRDLAWELFQFIEDQIPSLELNKQEEDGQGGNEEEGDVWEENECSGGNGQGNGEHGNINDDGSKAEGDEAKKGSGNQKGGAKAPKNLEELTKKQRRQELARRCKSKCQHWRIVVLRLEKQNMSRKIIGQMNQSQERLMLPLSIILQRIW
jgi:hypothetical protein